MGYPSVFPTGVLQFDKEKTWSGYTIFPSVKGALLIDMNGNEVNLWAGLGGFPNKILPGGYVLGTTGRRESKKAYQDQIELVQVVWDGNIVWTFDHTEYIEEEGFEPRWQARQHPDFQREGIGTTLVNAFKEKIKGASFCVYALDGNIKGINLTHFT